MRVATEATTIGKPIVVAYGQRRLVPRTGLEPVTLGLEGRCSVRLSYRGIFKEIFILSRERNRLSRFYREATGAFLRANLLPIGEYIQKNSVGTLNDANKP